MRLVSEESLTVFMVILIIVLARQRRRPKHSASVGRCPLIAPLDQAPELGLFGDLIGSERGARTRAM